MRMRIVNPDWFDATFRRDGESDASKSEWDWNLFGPSQLSMSTIPEWLL